jgi:hypothetical protein
MRFLSVKSDHKITILHIGLRCFGGVLPTKEFGTRLFFYFMDSVKCKPLSATWNNIHWIWSFWDHNNWRKRRSRSRLYDFWDRWWRWLLSFWFGSDWTSSFYWLRLFRFSNWLCLNLAFDSM